MSNVPYKLQLHDLYTEQQTSVHAKLYFKFNLQPDIKVHERGKGKRGGGAGKIPTVQKHYQDLGSDTSSVLNFCACSDVIL